SRVRVVEAPGREPLVPRRDIHGIPIKACPDLFDHGVDKSKIAVTTDAEVEEAKRDRIGDLLVEALEESGQVRAGRVTPNELLVVEQSIAEPDEVVDVEIQQPTSVKERRIDPVGDP